VQANAVSTSVSAVKRVAEPPPADPKKRGDAGQLRRAVNLGVVHVEPSGDAGDPDLVGERCEMMSTARSITSTSLSTPR